VSAAECGQQFGADDGDGGPGEEGGGSDGDGEIEPGLSRAVFDGIADGVGDPCRWQQGGLEELQFGEETVEPLPDSLAETGPKPAPPTTSRMMAAPTE